jgi:hypothetical protein
MNPDLQQQLSFASIRSGAKIDLLIMIAVGFGLSEALTISGGAKMVASVSLVSLLCCPVLHGMHLWAAI